MLRHAKLYEDELNKINLFLCDAPRYKYYYIGYFSLPELDKDEWNRINRVSIHNERVIGYFCASVNRTHCLVNSLLMFSIAKDLQAYKTFERDLLDFILLCLKQYRLIQWTVVVGNHVQKHYRRFVQEVGGNIVGVYHKSCKVGLEYLDEECYELLSTPETIKKVEKLRDRIHVKKM